MRVALAVAGGLLIGIATALAPASASSFWLGLLWLGWVLAVVWTFARSPFSVPFAALMFAMLLYIVIPATNNVVTGTAKIAGGHFERGLIRALQIATVAQWSMLVGGVACRLLMPLATMKVIRTPLSAQRVNRAAVVAAVAGVVGLVAFAGLAGLDVRQFFVFAQDTGYGTFEASGGGTSVQYFGAMRSAAGIGLILLVLRVTLARPKVRFWAVAAAGSAMAMFLVGTGQRWRLVVPAVACSLVWLKTRQQSLDRARRVMVGFVLAFLVVSAVVGVGRSSGSRNYSVGNLWDQQFGGGSDLFTPLAGLAEVVPERTPYLDGKSYAEFIPFMVPRALWPSKPTGSIRAIVAKFDNNAGIAFPEFGEFYANLGFIGVALGSIAFAALLEWLFLRYAATSSLRETVALTVVIALMLHLFTRGAFASTLGQALGLVIGMLAICRSSSHTLDSLSTEVPAAVVPT